MTASIQSTCKTTIQNNTITSISNNTCTTTKRSRDNIRYIINCNSIRYSYNNTTTINNRINNDKTKKILSISICDNRLWGNSDIYDRSSYSGEGETCGDGVYFSGRRGIVICGDGEGRDC